MVSSCSPQTITAQWKDVKPPAVRKSTRGGERLWNVWVRGAITAKWISWSDGFQGNIFILKQQRQDIDIAAHIALIEMALWKLSTDSLWLVIIALLLGHWYDLPLARRGKICTTTANRNWCKHKAVNLFIGWTWTQRAALMAGNQMLFGQ